MFLYSQSVEDANNSGMNLLDQSVIKKGMDYPPPQSKSFPVHSCLYDEFSLWGNSLFYKTQMFVHNYRTAAAWVKGHVGKKEMGRGKGNRQRETQKRETGTEATAISYTVHLVAILGTTLNNGTTVMYGTRWDTLLSKMCHNYFLDSWSLLTTPWHWDSSFSLCYCSWFFGGNSVPSPLCFELFLSLCVCVKCVAKYAHPERLRQPMHVSKSSYICVHDLVWLWNHPILLKGMWY